MTSVTEISLAGGTHLLVDGDAQSVEATILSAARGSLMELAWLTEYQTGEPVGINPDQVVMLRTVKVPEQP